MGERWMGVGSSAERDPYLAGCAAAGAALSGDDPGLLVVITSHGGGPSEVLRGVEHAAPGVPLVGCSSAGEISAGGVRDGSVVVAALGGHGFRVRTGLAERVAEDPRGAGALLAALVEPDPDREHQLLLLLTDGSANRTHDLVRGAYDVVGASLPLVGGVAGAEPGATSVQLWSGGSGARVLTGAAVGAAVCSDGPVGVGVQHGLVEVGEPMLITRTGEGGVILELDGEPALDAYLGRLDALDLVTDDAEAFAHITRCHPLGIRRLGGYDVRGVWSEMAEDRSLRATSDLAQRGLVRLMRGSAETLLDATDTACAEAIEGLGDRSPLGLLAFDCSARRAVLGPEGTAAEVGRLVDAAAGAPLAGLYTLGEIARTSGSRGFHNETLVVLALA